MNLKKLVKPKFKEFMRARIILKKRDYSGNMVHVFTDCDKILVDFAQVIIQQGGYAKTFLLSNIRELIIES